ncbi:TRAP transporter substrate-binding protein [Marinigracilibium pacificum]|uniref:TRAP transporter substrate-binding protein n=1 Tax=Marinigracilibium pacificum TaxID=2729599 RepID=UPI00232A215E|nr:TRAP transporter substrate-binding protein [Marinigracilibium pacificum]
MRSKIILNITLILSFAIFQFGCDRTGDKREIKLGHALDTSHPVHKGMVYMADRLKEKSDGKLTIKIYPGQQLGSERELVELLQIGSLGMTKVSSGTLENFAPGMKIFGLPFLFEDRDHAFRVLDGEVGQELLSESEEFWLKGITFYDAGSRSFYTKARPVNNPSDLNGLKIRVMESVSAMDMVRSLGGSPTPISWGELYTALQQGIVDGAENNPPSFQFSRHYEVCKFYTIDEHTMLPDVLIMSTIVWNSLDDQEKQWLMEAADESTEYQRKLWMEAEEEALRVVQAAGVEVIYPEKSEFKDRIDEMYDEYKKDEKMAGLITQIENMRNEK